MEPEKPICLSLHLCESSYRDPATGKSYLLGIMDAIMAQQIPCVVPIIVIHFELTNAAGEYELDVAVENELSEQQFATLLPQQQKRVKLESPLQVYAVNVAIHGLTFNAPGRYWFKVRANDSMVAQRPLAVRLVTGRRAPPPPSSNASGHEPQEPSEDPPAAPPHG